MSAATDKAYMEGRRAAYRAMLDECLRNLDVDDSAAGLATWVAERLDLVAKLRDVCEEHGDNDWPDTLHLVDVIEYHLARHLET